MDKPIYSLAEARQANAGAGCHWFSPDTLRWFRGRVLESTFTVVPDGTLFVSSERDRGEPRRYSVRFIRSTGERRGSVTTVGTFGQYASRNGALAALKRHAASWDGAE